MYYFGINIHFKTENVLCIDIIFYRFIKYCTTIHRYSIFSTRYSCERSILVIVVQSEIEHRARKSSGIISPYRRTNHALSPTYESVIKIHLFIYLLCPEINLYFVLITHEISSDTRLYMLLSFFPITL